MKDFTNNLSLSPPIPKINKKIVKFHGYDKKADWKNIKDILEIISKDIMDWFKINHSNDEVLFLKDTIKKEVKQEFEEYPDSVLLIYILEKNQ